MTENIELLNEALFKSKLEDIPLGAQVYPRARHQQLVDTNVARAAVVPACLVSTCSSCRATPWQPGTCFVLRLPSLVSWKFAPPCGLFCVPWLCLLIVRTPLLMAIVDGNAHFVSAQRSTLEAILLALAAGPPVWPPMHVGDAAEMASLGAAIATTTHPASQKVATVERRSGRSPTAPPPLGGCSSGMTMPIRRRPNVGPICNPPRHPVTPG
jgi:hypothetical protein